MTDALMTPRFNGAVVLLSILLATAASCVGLDLAQRVRNAERGAARAWCAGGALALGTGIWAMHFVGLLAFEPRNGSSPSQTLRRFSTGAVLR